MHKHAIYPPGHPLLQQAVEAVYGKLQPLLAERSALSIGVARRQLIIEGVATGSVHPLLGELAGKLHRHHIGAIKLVRGLEREELGNALGIVGVEAQLGEEPLGMQPGLESMWTHVRLFPLTYDRLELLDEDEEEGRGGRPATAQDGRAAQLWVSLARAAIAADRTTEDSPLDPEQVAHAIDEHDREPAYDQVIVGYLLQIANEVRADDTTVAATEGLKRRISRLVGALQPDTLRRLLEMGGDNLQRRRFVLDAAQGMSVEAVIELVQAAATAEGQTISHSLVRMLTKLATHATGDANARGRAADGAFRENVERLVNSWSLNDPNPEGYSAALEQMSRSGAAGAPPPDADDARFPCEPSRTIAMALEMGITGDNVARAVAEMLRSQSYVELLDLLDSAPQHHTEAIEFIWSRAAASVPLDTLLAAPRLEHQLIRRVVERTGVPAAPALIRALASSPDGIRRDRMIALLTSLGPDVAPLIAEQLAGSPSPLAKELLASLGRISPPTLPAKARGFLAHPDPSLRREAVRLLLAYDETREIAMAVAVRDEDERVVYAGLLAAQEKCSPYVAATIRQRMDRAELNDGASRVAAVRAVAVAGDDAALPWLLGRTVTAGRLLRRTRLAPTSPEMLAALSAIAARWRKDPRAAEVLEMARASSSPTVRAAVIDSAARMSSGGFKIV